MAGYTAIFLCRRKPPPVPVVVRYQDQLYPTLALEMARLYFLEDRFDLITQPLGDMRQVEGIRIGRNAGQYELAADGRAQVLAPSM